MNKDITEVTALVRRPTGVNHPRLRETFLDLSGRFDLEPVTGYDALVHLAYCVEEPHDKRDAYQVNVVATRALLEQANRVGIGHLVLTSSANALGVAACGTGKQLSEDSYPAGDQNPDNYYFLHKALLEHLANWHWANAPKGSTKLAVVRPCYVVGEHFDNSGLRALLGKPLLYPEPARSFYQFLWDADLVDAYATILTNGLSGIYNIRPNGPDECRGDQLDHRSTTDLWPVASFEDWRGPSVPVAARSFLWALGDPRRPAARLSVAAINDQLATFYEFCRGTAEISRYSPRQSRLTTS